MSRSVFKALTIAVMFIYISALSPAYAGGCGCGGGEFICYCCPLSQGFDEDASFSKCFDRTSDESNPLPPSIAQYSDNIFFLFSDNDGLMNEQVLSFCGYERQLIKPPAVA